MTSESSVTSAMAPSKDDRERFVYVAKLAEQMKRFEDMAEAMKKVAKLGVELTEDERLLFSSSYKNMISAKRDSWRILSSKEQEVVSKRNHQNARAAIEEYRRKVELEISGICNDAMAVLDDHLIPSTPCREAFTFYHKMKGDYYRYLAEFKSGNERKEAVEESCNAYQTATSTAESDLSPAHPIRLGVALNFSVFHYEIMNSPERACDLARRAFDHALNEIDTLSQERYKDSATIMRLLRDNINVWTTELFDDGCRDI